MLNLFDNVFARDVDVNIQNCKKFVELSEHTVAFEEIALFLRKVYETSISVVLHEYTSIDEC